MMKRLLILALLLFGLSACRTVATPESESDIPEPVPIFKPTPTIASLPDLGTAPELTNEVWLNVDAPLRLADLRGKVIALDMWTFG